MGVRCIVADCPSFRAISGGAIPLKPALACECSKTADFLPDEQLVWQGCFQTSLTSYQDIVPLMEENPAPPGMDKTL